MVKNTWGWRLLIVRFKTCIEQKALPGLLSLIVVSNMKFAYFYYLKHIKNTHTKVLRVHLRDAKNKNENFDANAE